MYENSLLLCSANCRPIADQSPHIYKHKTCVCKLQHACVNPSSTQDQSPMRMLHTIHIRLTDDQRYCRYYWALPRITRTFLNRRPTLGVSVLRKINTHFFQIPRATSYLQLTNAGTLQKSAKKISTRDVYFEYINPKNSDFPSDTLLLYVIFSQRRWQ